MRGPFSEEDERGEQSREIFGCRCVAAQCGDDLVGAPGDVGGETFEARPEGDAFRFQQGAREGCAGSGAASGEALGGIAERGDLHEKIGEFRRSPPGCRERIGMFEFEVMPQAFRGFAKGLPRGVDPGECGIGTSRRIGMMLRAEAVKSFFQRVRIQPRRPWDAEDGEVVRHAEKLSPQEQWASAFGLLTLKPPFCKSSE